MSDTQWKFYHEGVYGPCEERVLREFCARFGQVMSDERGVANGVFQQLWAEIDRLRALLSASPAPVKASPPLDPAVVEELERLHHTIVVLRSECRNDPPSLAPSAELNNAKGQLAALIECHWPAILAALRQAAGPVTAMAPPPPDPALWAALGQNERMRAELTEIGDLIAVLAEYLAGDRVQPAGHWGSHAEMLRHLIAVRRAQISAPPTVTDAMVEAAIAAEQRCRGVRDGMRAALTAALQAQR